MIKTKRVPYVLILLPLLAGRAASTWSIVVANRATGEVGVASATCLEFFNLQAGAGVIVVGKGAAQAQASIDFGPNRNAMFQLMKLGFDANRILQALQVFDTSLQIHQYGIATLEGPAAATFTGNGTLAYANGVTGEVGPIFYAIQGNILTCQAVIDAAEQALVTTPGDLGQKLMASMQAARSFGGDGRCSCSKANPTCGCPPPSFAKSAHIGYVTIARFGDVDGTCTPTGGCANGTYYLDLNVIAGGAQPDPVDILQGQYDAWRAGKVGHPDGVLSATTLAPATIPVGGPASATISIALADIDGAAITTGGATITVTHDETSAGLSKIGAPIDHGDGTYSVPLLVAANATGKDVFRVVVNDGTDPATLYPFPTLTVQVPGPLLWEASGFLSGEAFGSAVSSAGDLDGDGRPDVLVGVPQGHMGGGEAIGRARTFSGSSGSLLFQIEGTGFQENFGFAVAPLPDSPGGPRFLVGAPSCPISGCPESYVRVVSGGDGFTVLTVNGALYRFGFAVAALGDLSGDGTPDFAAGAPGPPGDVGPPPPGKVFVLSGTDGSTLFEVTGTGLSFGWSVAGLGDLDGDGLSEFAVGNPGFDAPEMDAGRATVHSGAGGALLLAVTGGEAEERLGTSVANAGRVNSDTLDDLLVGAPFADAGSITDAGAARIFSGANGALLLMRSGAVGGGLFGSSVAGLGDVDGDGSGDFAAGAPGAPPGGSALVYSGATGALLLVHQGLPGELAGFAVASAGDTDGDAVPDLLVGAPGADGGTGRVRVFSLSGLGGVVPTKLRAKVALQRDSAEPDPDARGTIDIRIRGDVQTFAVEARNLPAAAASSFGVVVESEPGSGTYTALGSMTLVNAAQGRWRLAVEETGTAPAAFGLASLAEASGRRVEVRDRGTVYLWAEIPPLPPEGNLSERANLSATGSVPGASGSVQIRYLASKGVSRFDLRAKGLSPFFTYGARIEDPAGSGTFVDVGILDKGRLRRDTNRGDPLPLAVPFIEALSGRGIQVREGSIVVLEGIIP
jgi:hypothetical protein